MTSKITIVSSQSGYASKTFIANLGETIRTNPQPIARYCIRSLAPVSEDVATIVEGLALADRLCTRRRSEGWTRRISVEIPIFEFEALSRTAAVRLLSDAVGYLTGDAWEITFVKRSGLPESQQYLPLTTASPKYVVPYSNGLDSFAQAKILQCEHGSDAVLTLRAGKLQHGGDTDRPLLIVPRRFYANHPRERTYRTRPLVYFSLAALGAATVSASSIVIGENGQGSLGPSLARFSDEWPFRSTHPGFIKRLQNFLNLAMGTNVEFQQPQLWRTKGEILRELALTGQQQGWEETLSCSMRPLQRDLRKACGLCGSCLLRRTALHNADYPIEKDVMFRIEENALQIIRRDGSLAAVDANAREIFLRSAMSMATFADVSSTLDAPQKFDRLAQEISDEPVENVSQRIASLSDRHGAEWRALLAALPTDAWLRAEFGSQ